MEAVIAEAPVHLSVMHCVPQVELRPGRITVLLNSSLHREEGHLSWVYDFSKKLLDSRTIHLMDFLQKALDSSDNVSSAVEVAFEKMNALLEPIVGVEYAAKGFWRVQNNSIVVVVQQGHVHVFGNASGMVFLCRDSQDKQLARLRDTLHDELFLRETLSKFNQYHKEPLTEKDEFLVVGAKHITDHMVGDFASILKTRVDAFGLVEACKQIAGRFPDSQPRTFVCVPLGDLNSFRGEADEPEPAADWVWKGRLPSEEVDLLEVEWEEEDEEWEEPFPEPSRRTHLYPISKESPQNERPATSCLQEVPRSACIRKFSFEKLEEPAMICEYNFCSIVVERGDITKWRIDGKTDAFVDVIAASSSGTSRELRDYKKSRYTWKRFRVMPPKREFLEERYKKLLSLAIADGVKHLGIPALFSDSIWSPESQLEAVYREAEEIIRIVVESIGKADMGSKEEQQQQRIQVHFVLNSNEVWRAFVAATDLLAHWDIADVLRWMRVKRAEKKPVQKPKPEPEPVVEEFPPLRRCRGEAAKEYLREQAVWGRSKLVDSLRELVLN